MSREEQKKGHKHVHIARERLFNAGAECGNQSGIPAAGMYRSIDIAAAVVGGHSGTIRKGSVERIKPGGCRYLR
jgi:hypothetical protein